MGTGTKVRLVKIRLTRVSRFFCRDGFPQKVHSQGGPYGARDSWKPVVVLPAASPPLPFSFSRDEPTNAPYRGRSQRYRDHTYGSAAAAAASLSLPVSRAFPLVARFSDQYTSDTRHICICISIYIAYNADVYQQRRR